MPQKHTVEFIQQEYKAAGIVPQFDHYPNNSTPLLCKCFGPGCENTGTLPYADFKRKDSRPWCADCKKTMMQGKYSERAARNTKIQDLCKGRGIEIIEYKSMNAPLVCKCQKCDTPVTIRPFSLQRGAEVLCEEHRTEFWAARSGENSPNYNHDMPRDDRARKRQMQGMRTWYHEVMKRDGFRCRISGVTKEKLSAHHIYSATAYPDHMNDLANGLTMTHTLHKQFHRWVVQQYGHQVCDLDLLKIWMRQTFPSLDQASVLHGVLILELPCVSARQTTRGHYDSHPLSHIPNPL